MLNPEKTIRLFSVHALGEAKTTGTPTINAKDKKIKAAKAS